MSIVLLTAPNPTSPSSISDYQYQNAYITATLQAFTGRALVNGATIKAGTYIKIADVLYKSTTDTAITGAETPYVKITPSGASASASFVADLTGVSWSHAHGQYLDGSGNLYVFDEAKAIKDGDISEAFTMLGRISTLAGNLSINGDLDGVVTARIGGVLAIVIQTPNTSSVSSQFDQIKQIPNMPIGGYCEFSHSLTNTGTEPHTISIKSPSDAGTYEAFFRGVNVFIATANQDSTLRQVSLETGESVTLTGYVRRLT